MVQRKIVKFWSKNAFLEGIHRVVQREIVKFWSKNAFLEGIPRVVQREIVKFRSKNAFFLKGIPRVVQREIVTFWLKMHQFTRFPTSLHGFPPVYTVSHQFTRLNLATVHIGAQRCTTLKIEIVRTLNFLKNILCTVCTVDQNTFFDFCTFFFGGGPLFPS